MYTAAVWSGEALLVWGGVSGFPPCSPDCGHGGRFVLDSRTWEPISTVLAPAPRSWHSGVWTGDRFLVWGGSGCGVSDRVCLDGGLYDPSTDTWEPVSPVTFLSPRIYQSAVWTGKSMLVWGGCDRFDVSQVFGDGASYDVASDTWSPLPTIGAPSARCAHKAFWTGREMIVWGGGDGKNGTTDGAALDLETGVWRPLNPEGAPNGGSATVWTGTEMLVWGGCETECRNGYAYDPVSDRWRKLSSRHAPRNPASSTAVWTGTEMIVWGGATCAGGPCRDLNDGGRYDPVVDTWTATTLENAPYPRSSARAVWTGSEMIIWGGGNAHYGAGYPNGGIFFP